MRLLFLTPMTFHQMDYPGFFFIINALRGKKAAIYFVGFNIKHTAVYHYLAALLVPYHFAGRETNGNKCFFIQSMLHPLPYESLKQLQPAHKKRGRQC